MKALKSLWSDVQEMRALPRVSINLMVDRAAGNDPFFARVVREFYTESNQRHRRFPLVRQLEYGVAVCVLPPDVATYMARIEASGRRNVKKAQRLGYEFGPIAYDNFLDDVAEIRRSAPVRQGRRMPDKVTDGMPAACLDPQSRDTAHAYPYFGVTKDGKLCAYAACLVSGELCMITHIYGHAEHQQNGVVPLLITGIAGAILRGHPLVRYYCYGSYFGAGESLRRFKRKFLFMPHRVRWELGGPRANAHASAHGQCALPAGRSGARTSSR